MTQILVLNKPAMRCRAQWGPHRCTALAGHDGAHTCQPCPHHTARHLTWGVAKRTPGYVGRHRAE